MGGNAGAPSSSNIVLDGADGSATFDGDVLIGSGKNANAGTNGAHVKLRDLNGIVVTTNNQPNFRGYNFGSGTPTSQINAGGSATFAGNVTANGSILTVVSLVTSTVVDRLEQAQETFQAASYCSR